MQIPYILLQHTDTYILLQHTDTIYFIITYRYHIFYYNIQISYILLQHADIIIVVRYSVVSFKTYSEEKYELILYFSFDEILSCFYRLLCIITIYTVSL